MRLKENVWNEKMSRGSQGQTLKWYIVAGLSGFALVNLWVLYKRVEFYMEHSFDIMNPDIDYIIERY